MTKSYINSRTINHVVIYSYTEMRITHFPTPWDELCSSRAGTLLYGFYQQLTNPFFLLYAGKGANPQNAPFSREAGKGANPQNAPFSREAGKGANPQTIIDVRILF